MNTNTNDPYNEFNDVVPVTVRNAALLLREAHKELEHARGVKSQYADLIKRAGEVVTTAEAKVRKAEYRLNISALQPNGGEE